jgi:hypothetical protein
MGQLSERFELEQQIMNCWNVVDDLYTLFEEVCENDELTQDQISNILLGLKELYQLKFEKLFRQFEQSIKETE